MPKLPLTIMFLFLFSAGVILGVYLYLHQVPPMTKTRTTTPAPLTTQEAHMVLLPLELPIASASGKLQVALTSGASSLTTVQIELSFDPTVLFVEDIEATPNTLLPNAVVLLKDINNARGRLSFALGKGEAEGESGSEPIALITYRVISYTKPQTTIHFLPKSLVLTKDSSSSILQHTEDATLTLSSFPASAGAPAVSHPPNTATPSPQ